MLAVCLAHTLPVPVVRATCAWLLLMCGLCRATAGLPHFFCRRRQVPHLLDLCLDFVPVVHTAAELAKHFEHAAPGQPPAPELMGSGGVPPAGGGGSGGDAGTVRVAFRSRAATLRVLEGCGYPPDPLGGMWQRVRQLLALASDDQ